MIVIAIDPGYDRIGWAVGEKPSLTSQKLDLTDFGCIVTQRGTDLFARYQEIARELESILQKYQPKAAVIETLFFSKNQKTALKVSEARGVIISTLLRHTLEIHELNPNQMKLAVTGNGNADKMAVEKMVKLLIPKTKFQDNSAKILDDAIDAIALLICTV